MTRTRIWIAGAVVIILTIAGLGWSLGVSPMLAEADAATEARTGVEAQNATLEAANALLLEQFENIDELESELVKLREQLPDGPEVESFIDYINGEAAAAGVVVSTIEAVEPNTYGTGADGLPVAPPVESTTPPAEGETANPPVDGGAAAAQTGTLFYSIGLRVTVQGSPDQVMAFSRGLQNGERLFFSKSVLFTSGANGELGGTVAGHLFVLDSPEDEEEVAEDEETTEDE